MCSDNLISLAIRHLIKVLQFTARIKSTGNEDASTGEDEAKMRCFYTLKANNS